MKLNEKENCAQTGTEKEKNKAAKMYCEYS